MSIDELLDSVEFVTDAAGNRRAVQLTIESWQEIVAMLPDEVLDAYWDKLFTDHPEVLERLADEAEVEIKAGLTKELIPEEL